MEKIEKSVIGPLPTMRDKRVCSGLVYVENMCLFENFNYTDSTKKFVINYSTQPGERTRRRGVQNVTKKRPGPTKRAKKAKTPIEAWNLSFLM